MIFGKRLPEAGALRSLKKPRLRLPGWGIRLLPEIFSISGKR